MNSLLIALAALMFLLIVFLAILGIWLYRSSQKGSGPEKESAMGLMQQQVDALRSQVSESLKQTNELLNQQLSNVVSQIQSQMSSVSQNMQSSAGQIYSRLDNYAQVVQEVSRQLGSLSLATEKIFETTKNIAALENILKPPKLRGGMGELLLENILREILPSEDFFSLQYSFKSGNKVDAVIRLKDGLIPIDAKFPLENFRKMIETSDAGEAQKLRKEFVKNVKKHIDDIAEKYILADEGTLNFALMYVPAENVYYETIIRNDPALESDDLYSYSTKKHVFPVSPNSLYPYMMTISLGFKGLKIEQQAKQILSELIRLQTDLDKFTKDFKLVGGHLSDAQKKFNEADKKLDQIDIKLGALKDGSPSHPALDLKGGPSGV